MLQMLMTIALANTTPTDYRIGAGDVVSLQVFNEPSLSRDVEVGSDCALGVALIGRVEACGLTTQELASSLETRFADGYLVRPHVVVEVSEYHSQTVEVIGKAKVVGSQPLKGPTPLIGVIAAAGGPSEEGAHEIVHVTSAGQQTVYLLSQLPDLDDVLVESGDAVIFREGSRVFVEGEVKKPGAVAFREGVTVTQALTLAGGPGDYANLRKVILRRASGEKVKINVQRIHRGVDSDPVLSPDDHLLIRNTGF